MPAAYENKPSLVPRAGNGLFVTVDLPGGTVVPDDWDFRTNDHDILGLLRAREGSRLDVVDLALNYREYIVRSVAHANCETTSTHQYRLRDNDGSVENESVARLILTRDVTSGEELYRTYGLEWVVMRLRLWCGKMKKGDEESAATFIEDVLLWLTEEVDTDWDTALFLLWFADIQLRQWNSTVWAMVLVKASIRQLHVNTFAMYNTAAADTY